MVLHIYLNTHPPFNAFRHGDAFHSAHLIKKHFNIHFFRWKNNWN